MAAGDQSGGSWEPRLEWLVAQTWAGEADGGRNILAGRGAAGRLCWRLAVWEGGGQGRSRMAPGRGLGSPGE